MRPGSVRLQLTLWGVAVLSIALLVFGAMLRYEMQTDILRSVDRDMANFSRLASNQGRSHGPGHDGPGPPPDGLFGGGGPPPGGPFGEGGPDRSGPDGEGTGSFLVGPMHLTSRYFTLGGVSTSSFTEEEPWDETTFSQSAEEGKEVYSTVQVDGEPLRILSLPLRDGGQIKGVLQIARPLADLQWSLDRLTRTLLFLIAPCLLVAGAGGAFLTSRVLSPVRRIALAAGEIEAKDLSARLPVAGGDEFAELARTFNGLLTRLETAFEQQKRFIADASHELKTPLAAIKVHTSLALRGERPPEQYRQTLRVVDRSVDSATRIVQDLLLLARSDTDRLQLRIQPIRLADILLAAAESVTAAAGERGEEEPEIKLLLSDPTVTIAGDAHHLTRLFTNLLENAVRHTPIDGTVCVSATADSERVSVQVSDTGEGIAPEHLPHVCKRFYRVDDSRARISGGVGLGLAIAQSIVEAHQGSLTLRSKPGEGTIVDVVLPHAV